MIKELYLTSSAHSSLDLDRWKAVFEKCPTVHITKNATEGDAVVMPVIWCERFGCPAGTSEETLGVMYVYDLWSYTGNADRHPRFIISNAVWKKEPPFDLAVKLRLIALQDAIERVAITHDWQISSVRIDTSLLLDWKQVHHKDVEKAITAVRTAIETIVNCH